MQSQGEPTAWQIGGAPCGTLIAFSNSPGWRPKDFMHCIANGEHDTSKKVWADPGCFYSAWQIADVDALPTDEVSNYMTSDPVVVFPTATIAELARKMTNAHIHRIIVVDEKVDRSGTDILAVVANADSYW